MLAVISPAKSLDLTTPLATERFSQPGLLDSAEELITLLKQLSPADIASLMKLSDKLALLNCERYNDWNLPFTPDNARQALLMFAGDVYTGIAATSFSDSDFDYAQSHLRILSGLYGVLKPLDLIQPYRLEMGTKLTNSQGANLYSFWQDKITKEINEAVAKQGDDILLNLASDEYFKSINKKQLRAKIITPVFKDAKNGQYKIISFYAKKARGMMAKFVIKNRPISVEALRAFNCEGYQFCEAESLGNRLIFKREPQK